MSPASASTSTAPTVALIGVGRMGLAMAQGWQGARGIATALSSIALIEPNPSEAVASLVKAKPKTFHLNPEPSAVTALILAVKPQSLAAVAPDLAGWIGPETRVVSIMAGVSINHLSELFATARVIRAMPNTPGALGLGITAFSASEACESGDLALARMLLAPLGVMEGPIAERHMDAVTAVSGSGPAYVFALVEAMANAGVSEGLDPDLSLRLARQTLIGAAALLGDADQSPTDLRRAVTSPKGTTEAALDVLMGDAGLGQLMRRAITAAARRSRALAKTK
jgi:pyrroline-5-carboxylate reductase